MLGKWRWLSVLLITVMATTGMTLSAGADSASEAGFLAKINASRATHGLAPLSVDGGLTSHARKHTQDMMDADGIFHSSSGELKAAAGSGWSKLGENVGRGGTVDTLHQAFMKSPGHKANVLGDYNKVGIGTGTKDGVLYVTVVFMAKGTSSGSSGSSGSTNPTPKPTTTTTTIPPTTTTTLIVGPDRPVTPGRSCVETTRLWWMCHD